MGSGGFLKTAGIPIEHLSGFGFGPQASLFGGAEGAIGANDRLLVSH